MPAAEAARRSQTGYPPARSRPATDDGLRQGRTSCLPTCLPTRAALRCWHVRRPRPYRSDPGVRLRPDMHSGLPQVRPDYRSCRNECGAYGCIYAQRCIKIHDLRIEPKRDFIFCSELSAAWRSPLRLPCSTPGLTSQNKRLIDVFSCARSAAVRRSRQGRKALRWHPPIRRKSGSSRRPTSTESSFRSSGSASRLRRMTNQRSESCLSPPGARYRHRSRSPNAVGHVAEAQRVPALPGEVDLTGGQPTLPMTFPCVISSSR